MGQDGPLSLVGGIVELCVCVVHKCRYNYNACTYGRLSSRSANKFRICYNSMNVYVVHVHVRTQNCKLMIIAVALRIYVIM